MFSQSALADNALRKLILPMGSAERFDFGIFASQNRNGFSEFCRDGIGYD